MRNGSTINTQTTAIAITSSIGRLWVERVGVRPIDAADLLNIRLAVAGRDVVVLGAPEVEPQADVHRPLPLPFDNWWYTSAMSASRSIPAKSRRRSSPAR